MHEKLDLVYEVDVKVSKLYSQNSFYSFKCKDHLSECVKETDNSAFIIEEVGENISDLC